MPSRLSLVSHIPGVIACIAGLKKTILAAIHVGIVSAVLSLE
jgi:hypothetical protein